MAVYLTQESVTQKDKQICHC